MNGKLKKILCLALCLCFVAVFAFTLTACDRELTEEEKEILRKELLASVDVDVSRAELTANATYDAGNEKQIYVAWEAITGNNGDTPSFNADIIVTEHSLLDASLPVRVTLMFVRGDDGYTVSFNFNKVIDRVWNILYSVAEVIDENSDVSLNTLYANEQVKETLEQLPISAAQLETAVNQAIEQINGQLPAEQQIYFTALPAEQGETVYAYLGRYLPTETEPGQTIGGITVGELLCTLFGTSVTPDLTALMDKAKFNVVAYLKQLTAFFKFDLNFSKDKKLTGIRLGVVGSAEFNVVFPETLSLVNVG